MAAFEDILGAGLSPVQRIKADVPTICGGCGVRVPNLVQPAAGISALLKFYKMGRHAVGVPEFASQLQSKWLSGPLEDLAQLFGPNFDAVSHWKGNHPKVVD